MFYLYISSGFMLQLASNTSEKKDTPLFKNFCEFLKTVKDVIIITDVPNVETIENHVTKENLEGLDWLYWKRLTSNGNSIICDAKIFDEILSEKTEIEAISFFLTDDSRIQNFIIKRGYHFVDSGKIEELWSKFDELDRFKSCSEDEQRNEKFLFCSWKKMAEKSHNFHSLIFRDNYLFAKEKDFKYNIPVLLDALLSGNNAQTCEIVFNPMSEISTPGGIEKKLKIVDDVRNSSLAKPKTGRDITIKTKTILLFFGHITERLKKCDHDRHIITNNFIITSGPGFNLFGKKKGKHVLKQITSVSVGFIFWPQNLFLAKKILQAIQEYIDKVGEKIKTVSGDVPIGYPDAKVKMLFSKVLSGGITQ